MPHLIFSQHGKTLLQFPLTKSNTQIGRSSECDVVLTEASISRLQLSVHQIEGSYFVKNLGKAKLKLNGKEVESSSLSEKDYLELETWRIHLEHSEKNTLQDETYISDAGMQSTQVLNLSRVGQDLHYESLVLKVQSPHEAEKIFQLREGTNTIGKAISCDIRLSDSYASDVHAKLICEKGKVLLYDLKSTNGTFVNGMKVGEVELEEGSICKMGHSEIRIEMKSQVHSIQALPATSFGPFIGQSKAMQELYSLIQQIAPTSAPVAILSETGTGKELVAQSLHDLSGRKGSWIPLNCGAIAKELIQSELFGHEKGAFTGAQQQRHGVFEQAKGGTLFLDEVAELPLELQASLLRVLETGKIRRVGGTQEIAVDVRVICATHQDLPRLVAEKKFREDLYFRLNVLPIFLPPLRERQEDIPLLANHFIKIFSSARKSLSESAVRFLQSQDWPGNIRELKNAIQRAVILAKGEVLESSDFSFLAASTKPAEPKISATLPNLMDVEKNFILQELERQNFNKLATSKALGIAKSTLYEKLKLYGI